MNNPNDVAAEQSERDAVFRLIEEADQIEGEGGQNAWLARYASGFFMDYQRSVPPCQGPVYVLKSPAGAVRRSMTLSRINGRTVPLNELEESDGDTASQKGPDQELSQAEWDEVLAVPEVRRRFGLDDLTKSELSAFLEQCVGTRRDQRDTKGERTRYMLVGAVQGAVVGVGVEQTRRGLKFISELRRTPPMKPGF